MSEALPTILVALVLAAAVALIVRKIVRDRRSGCSCGCGSCPHSGSCGARRVDN